MAQLDAKKGGEELKGILGILCWALVAAVLLSDYKTRFIFPEERIFILLLENLFLTLRLPLAIKSIKKIRNSRERSLVLSNLLLWVISYLAAYGSFAISPQEVSIFHFMLARAGAPLLAVFLSGDFRLDRMGKEKFFFYACSFLLLGLTFALSIPEGAVKSASLTALILIVATIFQQTAIRNVSKKISGLDASPFVGFGAAIGLSLMFKILYGRESSFIGHCSTFNVLYAFFFAVVVLFLQFILVYGVKKARPYQAALFIPSSIPISLLVASLSRGELPKGELVALIILYFISLRMSYLGGE